MNKMFSKILRERKQMTVRYDATTKAIWVYLKPRDCPCLNLDLLNEYHGIHQDLIDYFHYYNMMPKIPIKFFVLASHTPDIYGYGGNILEITETVKKRDREKIDRCAKVAIKDMYNHVVNLHLPIHTVTLVEGLAVAGGFEKTLSFNAVIAEEQSLFGLQQMRFNFLPGSAIYSLLARKVGMRKADEIIVGMKTYSADDMKELGVVTQVAKKGEGKKAVDRYLRKYLKGFNGLQALHAAKMRYRPFEFQEMEDMAKIWVDSLMNLDEKDIKMMEIVAKKQKETIFNIPLLLRAKQDRRLGLWDVEFPLIDSDGSEAKEDRRHQSDPRESDSGDQ